MKKLIALTMVAGVFTAGAHSYHDSDYEKVDTKNLTLSAEALKDFAIDAGAGSLTLIGHDKKTIDVTAEIYQKDKGEPYCLSLEEKSSAKAKLKANTCHNDNHTRIDVAVYLPSTLLTKINDGSGPINIQNTSVYKVNDGSGGIVITNNNTTLEVNDGSGSIKVREQIGALTINDGSGSVKVSGVEGHVNVSDGSGSIDVSDVAGDVKVSDGSGSIRVDNAHHFELLSDGSGSVNVTNVNNKM